MTDGCRRPGKDGQNRKEGAKMRRRPFSRVLLAGLALVLAAAAIRFGWIYRTGRETILTSATLKSALDIADLSTAEFQYRGIAEVYEQNRPTVLRCRVCYSATVKAGIDLNRMEDPVIDHEAKKVILRLPEIQLKAGIVDEDEMRTMPANASVSLPEMRKASLADAKKEAKASGELTRTARENLESTIRGWLYPLLKQQGYTLVFE
jgi:hypothetical protein